MKIHANMERNTNNIELFSLSAALSGRPSMHLLRHYFNFFNDVETLWFPSIVTYLTIYSRNGTISRHPTTQTPHHRTHPERHLTDRRDFAERQLDFVGIQESKVPGTAPPGGLQFEGAKYAYHFSGVEAGVPRTAGVGLAISNKWNSRTKITCVDERIIWGKIDLGTRTLAVMSVYAPCELARDIDSQKRRDKFYKVLSETLKNIQRECCPPGGPPLSLLVLGDFNARVGSSSADNDDGLGDILGQGYSDKGRTQAGTDLLDCCCEHSLRIESSFFEPGESGSGTHHHAQHKAERVRAAHDPETAKRIYPHVLDHILTHCSKDVFKVNSCGVIFGVEPLSDHRPVEIDFEVLTTPPDRRRKKRKKFGGGSVNYAALADPALATRVKDSVEKEMDRLMKLCNPDESELLCYSGAIDALNAVIKKVCGAVLPPKQRARQSPDWFIANKDSLTALTKAKAAAWANVLASPPPTSDVPTDAEVEHRRCCHAVTAACRRAKSEFWENMAKDLNALLERNDTGAFFKVIKRKRGLVAVANGSSEILSADGTVLYKDPPQILIRWREHFEKLFNQSGDADYGRFIDEFLPPQQKMATHASMAGVFTREELQLVIDQLRTGKAPGLDGIPNEVYMKVFSSSDLEVLLESFNLLLSGKPVPAKLKDVVIAVLYKKGDTRVCDNYRGISLINREGLLLELLIQNRLRAFTESAGDSIIPNS